MFGREQAARSGGLVSVSVCLLSLALLCSGDRPSAARRTDPESLLTGLQVRDAIWVSTGLAPPQALAAGGLTQPLTFPGTWLSTCQGGEAHLPEVQEGPAG